MASSRDDTGAGRGERVTTYLPGSRHVARKKYTCNACEWISEWIGCREPHDYKFTYAELREIVKARRNAWCIVPGQEYIKQPQVYDGHFFVWRAIPAIHAICLKYDLYEWV